ncbi:MAG: peroxiredoxin-like family protein [Ahrensia sp.]|nr:peroxiredoxin-like family protein [Ahrensia sp.]
MPAPVALIPSKPIPPLSLKLVDGNDWSTQSAAGENFALITFYRGFHCPKCKEQLQELQSNLTALRDRGVSVTAISMDPQGRAERARDEWDLDALPIAYGLTQEQAAEWGLHLSTSRGKTSMGVEETKIFNEPGLFLVRADGTLYASWVQTVPFARPKTADLLSMIDFVLDKDYPPRGTLAA